MAWVTRSRRGTARMYSPCDLAGLDEAVEGRACRLVEGRREGSRGLSLDGVEGDAPCPAAVKLEMTRSLTQNVSTSPGTL